MHKAEFEKTIGPKCHFIGCDNGGEFFITATFTKDNVYHERTTYACERHRKVRSGNVTIDDKGDLWLVS